MTTENGRKQRKTVTHKGAQFHIYPDGRVVDHADTTIEDVALIAILIGLAYDNEDHQPEKTVIHQTFSPNAVTEEAQVPRPTYPATTDFPPPGFVNPNNVASDSNNSSAGTDNGGGVGGDSSFE